MCFCSVNLYLRGNQWLKSSRQNSDATGVRPLLMTNRIGEHDRFYLTIFFLPGENIWVREYLSQLDEKKKKPFSELHVHKL